MVLFFALAGRSGAQVLPDSTLPHKDSLPVRDSLPLQDSVRTDSIPPLLAPGQVVKAVTPHYDAALSWRILDKHPWLGFNAPVAGREDAQRRVVSGKEWLFYLIVLIFILFASLRRLFYKYFTDLFRLFFRTTLKQRQIREQLMQTPLPSVLLNGFFVITAGLYISFLLEYFGISATGNFWLNYLYSCAALSLIYLVKFISLRISGWIFNVPDAASAYIFIVFIINKMIGIFLLPFLLLLAFSEGYVYVAAMTVSWCLVGGLLGYRVILSVGALRNQVRLNLFHFLLYIMAFEVAPLLLIYKALISFLVQSS